MADEAMVWVAVAGAAGTAIGAAFGAIGGWMSKRAEKAPDIQSTLTAAIADVVDHYKRALDRADGEASGLREEIADLRRLVEVQNIKIEEQTAEISSMIEHIGHLETSIRDLGGKPPPRRRRVKGDAGGVA